MTNLVSIERLEQLATERPPDAVRDVYVYFADGGEEHTRPNTAPNRYALKVQCPTKSGLLTAIMSHASVKLLAIVAEMKTAGGPVTQIAKCRNYDHTTP